MSGATSGARRRGARRRQRSALATLASRVLGYVAGHGGGARLRRRAASTDAFFVAFRIPNILRRLLAEGALSTAVIPVFSDYLANRRPRRRSPRMLRAVAGAARSCSSAW